MIRKGSNIGLGDPIHVRTVRTYAPTLAAQVNCFAIEINGSQIGCSDHRRHCLQLAEVNHTTHSKVTQRPCTHSQIHARAYTAVTQYITTSHHTTVIPHHYHHTTPLTSLRRLKPVPIAPLCPHTHTHTHARTHAHMMSLLACGVTHSKKHTQTSTDRQAERQIHRLNKGETDIQRQQNTWDTQRQAKRDRERDTEIYIERETEKENETQK